MFAALALTAMVPVAASARGGGGGGHSAGGGGGGHFAGGGGHFSGGGTAHFSAARVSGGGVHFSSVPVGPYAQSAHNKANRPKNPAGRTGSRAAQQTLEIG